MTTLRALFYADVRSFVNQLREIRQSPARALIWLLFAALVAALIGLRIFNAAHANGINNHGRSIGNRSVLDTIVSIIIVAFGVVLAFGDRYAGLFAHPAEARFIIDSPAEPFVATLYVQTRQIVRGGARQAIGLLYIAVVYLPSALPAAALVRDLVLLCRRARVHRGGAAGTPASSAPRDPACDRCGRSVHRCRRAGHRPRRRRYVLRRRTGSGRVRARAAGLAARHDSGRRRA